MIQTNEVRRGNLLLNPDGKVVVVVASIVHLMVGYHEIGRRPTTGKQNDADKMKGIPLSEEWMRRFGFTGNGSLEKYLMPLTLGWNSGGMYIMDSKESAGPYLSHIQFVHQLQNLYFALTGEELQIEDHDGQ
jgi:hypothetical protein